MSSPLLAGVAPLAAGRQRWPYTRVVVVAPHPDDEVFGAGGLLQWLSGQVAGIEVLSVSDGEAAFPLWPSARRNTLARRRQLEARVAMHRLGLGPVNITRLGLADGDIEPDSDLLADALAGILSDDTLCLAPWCHDGHPDHDTVGRVTEQVCNQQRVALLGYLVWAWHWADPRADDLPWGACRRWRLTPVEQARKRYATEAFESLILSPGPGSNVEAVIPPAVLRCFWRSFEIFVSADART